jgi:hypothetical protein
MMAIVVEKPAPPLLENISNGYIIEASLSLSIKDYLMNIEQHRSKISQIIFPNEPEYINPDTEFSICKKDNLIELARLFYEKYKYIPDNNWVRLIQLMFSTNSLEIITCEDLMRFYQTIEEHGCANALKTLDNYPPYKNYMITASYEKAIGVLDERYEYYCRPDFSATIPR